jgi:hypothetical protein
MIFTKHRFEIWNGLQHPFKHTLGDFSYVNPAAPGTTSLEGALNWIFAVLYPQTKAAVANPAALPLVGNTLNDYRVVQDDGDGKAAAYRWEQREGEVSPSWHKIYDMDWGQDSILEAFTTLTQDYYVWRDGRDQVDGSGAAITGLLAGQRIFGGKSANTNLTLSANSGDGTGANTGFVQVTDQFRPVNNNLLDIGTSSEKFRTGYFGTSALVGTLTLSSGSITDSSGTISFDNENLTTTGNITGAIVTGSSLVADDTSDTVTLVPGSYTDTTGAVSFGGSSLVTTGTLGAGVTTLTDNAQTLVLDPDASGVGSITSSTGTISFDNENLVTTGTLQAGAITAPQLDIDNIRLDGNTISITNSNGNLILAANGTGVVDVQSPLTTLGQTVTGVMAVTGQLNIDNMRLDGNVISTTNLNGDLTITPNGTGTVITSATFKPAANNTLDLGATGANFKDLHLQGAITNGTDSITVSTLLSLRSSVYRDLAQTQPAQAGDTLFWDAVNSVWLANHPDTEITHAELSGLTTGDAGHTQFVMLAGRSGGQTIQGGTAASENLIFESTSHGTKGSVQTKDHFIPFTNASFSVTWSGTDLGSSSNYFRDLYTKGELKGARFENFTSGTLPASSAQNVGRVVFATDNNKAYIDTGSAFIVLGSGKFTQDTSWNGSDITKSVDVSATITDARLAVWQLRNNAGNFEIMGVKITTPNATTVQIDTNIPLPVGSYRLIGIE